MKLGREPDGRYTVKAENDAEKRALNRLEANANEFVGLVLAGQGGRDWFIDDTPAVTDKIKSDMTLDEVLDVIRNDKYLIEDCTFEIDTQYKIKILEKNGDKWKTITATRSRILRTSTSALIFEAPWKVVNNQ